MKRAMIFTLSLLMLATVPLVGSAATSNAGQPPRGNEKHHTVVKSSKPRVGSKIASLPSNRVKFTYKNRPYYFCEGVVYLLSGNQYEVVDLVKGMIIPSLPAGELRLVVIGNKTYYENRDIIYEAVRTRDGQQYQIVGWID